MLKLSLIIGMLLAPSFAPAQEIRDSMARCASIPSASPRLKCYDALSARLSATEKGTEASPQPRSDSATADPGIQAGTGAGKVLVRDSTDVPDDLRKVIQGGLGELVRDPESVRVTYQLGFIHEGFATICGRFNAKNAYGGYVGYQWYIARARVVGANWEMMGGPEVDLVFENTARQACAFGEQ